MMEYTRDDLPEEELEKISQRDDQLKRIHGKTNIQEQKLKEILFASLDDQTNQQVINHYLLQFFNNKQDRVNGQYHLLQRDDIREWASQAKLSQDGYKLNHFNDYARADVQQFVYNMNWNHVELLDFSYCGIDDQGWRTLVDNAHLFLNLKVLVIYQNKIKQIRQRDLQKFRSLQSVQIQYNPLSYATKDVLKRFTQFNPKITLKY